MSFVDGNTWYWITEWRVNWTSGFTYNGNGDLYFAAANASNLSNGMQWQIYELPNERFQFRSRNSNTRKQLGVCYDPEEISTSRTQPCMEESSADESQQWTITEWGDGSYRIQNVQNGTDFNLDWHPGGPGFISPDTEIAPIQPAQHWIFSSVGVVQDGLYSTSIIPVSTSTGASATNPTSVTAPASASASATRTNTADAALTSSGSPSQQSSSGDSGLSTGAAAGIGIGVAIGVIALAALAFFLIRRRRSQPKQETMQELPGTSSDAYDGNAAMGKTYEKKGPEPVYEAPDGHQTYEMGTTPSELPAGEYRR